MPRNCQVDLYCSRDLCGGSLFVLLSAPEIRIVLFLVTDIKTKQFNVTTFFFKPSYRVICICYYVIFLQRQNSQRGELISKICFIPLITTLLPMTVRFKSKKIIEICRKKNDDCQRNILNSFFNIFHNYANIISYSFLFRFASKF